jgi:transcription factor C subunit 6
MHSSTSEARQRHRAIPLFSRPGLVERLGSPPVPYGFGSPKTTYTNNFTATQAVVDRVTKALGHNVGNGPIWELLEDRSWFKEGEQESEGKRRPIVYEHVCVKPGWEILDDQYVEYVGSNIPSHAVLRAASHYLPNNHQAVGEDRSKPSSSISCLFGPILGQTRVELPIFQTHRLCMYTMLNGHFTASSCICATGDFIPESKAHVFNAGAPIWGLDWCPIHIEDRSGKL